MRKTTRLGRFFIKPNNNILRPSRIRVNRVGRPRVVNNWNVPIGIDIKIIKWWLRFKTEPASLWVKVIKSIYGASGGLSLCDNINYSTSSSVWSCIIKTGGRIDASGVNFRNSFKKEIGDGANTSFWNEIWFGSDSLKNRFKRLARLEVDLNASFKDRVSCDGSSIIGLWNWKRTPTGRAQGELEALNLLVQSVKMAPNKLDSWAWQLNGGGNFKTKILSDLLMSRVLGARTGYVESLHNNFTPKKVEVFIWRLRKGRIPVLTELNKRGVDLNSVRCAICDGDVETINHSIFTCNLAHEIWSKVNEWWGLGCPSNKSVNEMFLGKPNVPMSPLGMKLWQAVEWTCGYLI
ncbi:uncharacterized protein [Rutidosis leptorrhynchoides]|uniref:uncharacterized protein n=1 Tax=Rutidosis leptorrhynchoides TaxID=125765 RepID=UPI003A98E743